MKKRILSLLLVFVMLASLAIMPTSAYAWTLHDQYFTYELIDGEISVVAAADREYVTIPESIEGFPVTQIGNFAFFECVNLKEIVIPDGVKEIGDCAFENCTSLTKISVPESVVSIGGGAIRNTGYYNDENNWDNGVLYLGRNLIEADDGISGNYSVKAGTVSIAGEAFGDCISLASISLPDSVRHIGDWAFSGCSNLSDVKLGKGLVSLGRCCFYACDSLDKIEFPDTLKTIGNSAFCQCKKIRQLTIPNSVTSIEQGAFSACQELEYVSLSKNLEKIEVFVFVDCANLKEIVIPDGVKEIGDCAFENCTSLTKISVPESVVSISGGAIRNTGYYNDENNWDNGVLYLGRNLIEAGDSISGDYSVKAGTVSIAGGAFEECANITSVTIPDSVRCIGAWTFYGCSNLSDVKMGSGIEIIDRCCFSGCDKLSEISYAGTKTMWSKILIGEGNENLTNDTVIHYNCGGNLPDRQITVDFEKNEITVISNKEIKNAFIPAAVFDAKGRLLDAEFVIRDLSKGENTFDVPDVDYADASNVKVMVWSGMGSIAPEIPVYSN